MLPERPCDECQKPFLPGRKTQRFCCKPCKVRNLHRDWIRRHPERAKDYERRRSPEQMEKRRQFVRDWRDQNREAVRASDRERHQERKAEANAGRSRRYYADHDANRRKGKVRYRHARITTPQLLLLWSSRNRAKTKGISFDLTEDWANDAWTGRCALTDIPFDLGVGKHTHRMRSPSIDRIDPSIGYTPENCRFILWMLNAFKGTGTDADMIEVARVLAQRFPAG